MGVDAGEDEQDEVVEGCQTEHGDQGAESGQIHVVRVQVVPVVVVVAVAPVAREVALLFGAVPDHGLYGEGYRDDDEDAEHAGDPEAEVQADVRSRVDPALYVLPRTDGEGDQLGSVPQDGGDGNRQGAIRRGLSIASFADEHASQGYDDNSYSGG